jgi:hypothetical protein
MNAKWPFAVDSSDYFVNPRESAFLLPQPPPPPPPPPLLLLLLLLLPPPMHLKERLVSTFAESFYVIHGIPRSDSPAAITVCACSLRRSRPPRLLARALHQSAWSTGRRLCCRLPLPSSSCSIFNNHPPPPSQLPPSCSVQPPSISPRLPSLLLLKPPPRLTSPPPQSPWSKRKSPPLATS